MAKMERTIDREEPASRIPRPVPGSTESIEGLGGFVDDVLMAHTLIDRRIARDMEAGLLSDEEEPKDPPPSQAPPPVPGGDEPVTRGPKPQVESRGLR